MLTRIRKKATKLSHAYRYRKRIDATPCFWHLGSPNFGDDLNPLLIAELLQTTVYRDKKQSSNHILGVGSILERANSHSIVIGSGFINENSTLVEPPLEILAVRGELTKHKLKLGNSVLLGDPGRLMPSLMGINHNPTIPLAIVPHVDRYKEHMEKYGSICKVIDPSMPVRQVLEDIASAEVIVSQSLHGLVMADALNIPNLWAKPHSDMLGGEFKFNDYYTTTTKAKQPHHLSDLIDGKLWRSMAFISQGNKPLDRYKTEYSECLHKALKIIG